MPFWGAPSQNVLNSTGCYLYLFCTPVAVPAGFLECNGTAVSRVTYSALFALIGTTFGVGDGSTTFNLPDFRGTAPMGQGQRGGLTLRNLGDFVGEETHLLTNAEAPALPHVHGKPTGLFASFTGGAITLNGAVSGGATDPNTSSASPGSGGTHNNMQPSLCAGRWIVKT